MSHSERGLRRITSIPPRTSLDVLRGATSPIGGGNLLGGARGVSRELTDGERDWSKIVDKHVFQKPLRREKARRKPLYEGDGGIEWETEAIEGYNSKGDMGIILQFTGIEFTKEPFSRGRRYYGKDTTLFYSQIIYRSKQTLLILATTGDIFEAQVVPARKDVRPFFQQELHLPQLTTTHDPTTMAVLKNNGLVIVGYNKHA